MLMMCGPPMTTGDLANIDAEVTRNALSTSLEPGVLSCLPNAASSAPARSLALVWM